MKEYFWREKWNLEGDGNTAYFHRVTKIKHKLKPISLLMHNDRDMSMVDDTIPLLVDDNMNVILTKLPSLDEISSVVFILNKDGASSLDDFRRSLLTATVLTGRRRLLSMRILQLVSSNSLNLITSLNNLIIPSHILYTNDVFIFYKVVNCGKSCIYGGAMSNSRLNILGAHSGFQICLTPFLYLWVPFFKGRMKLVKSTILGMLNHNMAIYACPFLFLCDIERAVRMFFWSGETSKNKLVIMAWNNICKSIAEGRLGIRSLFNLNEVSNLNLAWDLCNSSGSWLAYEFKRNRGTTLDYWKWIWNKFNPPCWPDIWRFLGTMCIIHSKVISKVATIFTLNSIWKAQNLVIFNDTSTTFYSSTFFTMVVVSVADNSIVVGPHLSLHDFEILKRFKVTIRPSHASNILEFFWQPPPRNWIKFNYDGASKSPSGSLAYGVISRDNGGSF
ncbi:unnamed protein product [Vicia faba]|uniref:Uncharacterized protein n=1 Tax=Vicia faba TaxID=3906 RepID=A0AAV1BAK9_VICFA|nr:unnamed protein product [Vicia faba]